MATKQQEKFRICRTVANAIMIIANETVASPEDLLNLIAERIGADNEDKRLILKDCQHQSCVDSHEHCYSTARG